MVSQSKTKNGSKLHSLHSVKPNAMFASVHNDSRED
jgi:hypothetical protein